MDLPDTPQPMHRHPRFHAMKGSSRQALGWLTFDRRVEARGDAEPTQLGPPSAAVAGQAEHLVHPRDPDGPGIGPDGES